MIYSCPRSVACILDEKYFEDVINDNHTLKMMMNKLCFNVYIFPR